MNFELK